MPTDRTHLAPTPRPSPPRTPSGYRALRRAHGFWRIAAVGMASKLAPGMTGLSLLLLVGRDHSYATAGLAVSCSAIGQGLTAPVRGRLVDRRSPRLVLLGCLTAHLTATAALLVTVHQQAPLGWVLALAAAMGATVPPAAAMMRSIWHSVTDTATLGTAMALDSAMTGTALITGPVLAAWLSLSVSRPAPFALTTALTTVVVTQLALTSSRHRPQAPPPGLRTGTLAFPRLRRLLAADVLFVTAVTALDVVLPTYAQEYGATRYTGWYLGALSLGSVLGSLALGAVPARLVRGPRPRALLCLFAAGAGTLAAVAHLSPLAVLVLCPVAGLAIGSVFAALRTAAGDLAPVGAATEAMSWLNSADLAGSAAGAALFAHLAAAQGSRAALALVPGVAAAAAVAMAVGPTPRCPRSTTQDGP